MLSRTVQILITTILAGVCLSACEPGPSGNGDTSGAKNTVVATPEPTKPACRLIMGWDPWEPYHYRDVGGEVHGLDIELVAAIAREAGCELRFDQEDWATLLTRLRLGQIDLLSGATKTEDRAAFAWFTEPYRSENFRLYVRDGEADKIKDKTLGDLLASGFTIGTTLEYIYGDEVEAYADEPRYSDQFLGVAVGEVNYDKLSNYKIDGLLEDDVVAASVIRKQGLEDDIDEYSMLVSSGDVHLMLSKANVDEQTLTRLNEALERIKASGTYQAILDRYLN